MSIRTAAELSVVIVSFNSRQHLAACLQSLYAQSCPPHMEMFVVDNASQDGSAGLVAARFPGVTLIRNRQNIGFARACNRAIRRSSGRYVLLLNPDTVVHNGALEAMVRFADQHPQIGALGPMILDQAGGIDYRCARRLPTLFTEFLRLTRLSKRFPNHRILGWAHFGEWDHRSSRAAPCLVGACMLVRSAAIEQVGLLDEDFFLYGEDVEWCARIARGGWQVYYYSDATVTHLGGGSSAGSGDALGLELLYSRALDFRKRHGRGYERAYRTLVALSALGKLVLAVAGLVIHGAQRWRPNIQQQARVLHWTGTLAPPLRANVGLKDRRPDARVVAVILNHNQYEDTSACLRSLQGVEYGALSILLVDNGSVDGSGERLAREFPDVQALLLPENRGVAGGRNAGAHAALAAGAGYILFLDNDTEVAPDFLRELVSVAESDALIGGVAPLVFAGAAQDRVHSLGGRYYVRLGYGRLHLAGKPPGAVPSHPILCDWINGVAGLFRAEVFTRVGPLDLDMMRGQDLAWSLQVRRAGYKLCATSSSVVMHKRRSGVARNAAVARRWAGSRIILLSRYVEPSHRGLALLFYVTYLFVGRRALPFVLHGYWYAVRDLILGVGDGLSILRKL